MGRTLSRICKFTVTPFAKSTACRRISHRYACTMTRGVGTARRSRGRAGTSPTERVASGRVAGLNGPMRRVSLGRSRVSFLKSRPSRLFASIECDRQRHRLRVRSPLENLFECEARPLSAVFRDHSGQREYVFPRFQDFLSRLMCHLIPVHKFLIEGLGRVNRRLFAALGTHESGTKIQSAHCAETFAVDGTTEFDPLRSLNCVLLISVRTTVQPGHATQIE